jgi:hypothetical protein
MRIEGLKLPNGWTVLAQINKKPGATGGHFSRGYKVRNDTGQEAFSFHAHQRFLEATIRNYIDVHNEKPKPFIWTKTADDILDSVARFCKRTLGTPH